MNLYKTRITENLAYTYTDALGRKYTLKPGDVDARTGYILTEEDIKRLIRMDNTEVYNNLKHARRPLEDWEKPIYEAWKEAHPGERIPGRSNVSMDAVSVYEDEGEWDSDKSVVMAAIAVYDEVEVSAEVDHLYEVVEMMTDEQKELFKRVLLDEERVSAIAQEKRMGRTALANKVTRIKKFIKENF